MLPILKIGDDLSRVLNRSQLDMEKVNFTVKEILADVKLNGDEALFRLTEKFDGVKLDSSSILVTEQEIDEAYNLVDKATIIAMRSAKENIIAFHKRQLRQSNIVTEGGKTTGYIIRPVSRAGVYVPGGKAAYPSSVLMCALPAVVAGVKEIVMATPAGKWLNPLTLVAARECGINKIYKVGGAQAIAALSYGTESIGRVDVISGPGNIYVAMAKREVFGNVGIDMIAGPSEILIIADESANAQFVAADLLSQAEHDELAVSLLLTTSRELAEKVQLEVEKQLKVLSKAEIAGQSIANYGAIVLVNNIEEAIALSNRVAPEHLELCLKDGESYLDKIQNAGAVFLGNYSPEPLGDYYAGTNHVLPTSGSARFFSALGVDNYIKKISIIKYDRVSLKKAKDDIINLANTEGLTAHANAIKVRFKD